MEKREIIAGLFILLFLMPFLSSVDWILNKDQTCVLFNKTFGVECESFWCASIRGGNYSNTLELCQFYIVVNNTIFVNGTNITNFTAGNFTINESLYFNKTFVYNKTEIDDIINNKTATLRDSIADNYATKSSVDLLGFSQDSSSNDFNLSSNTILIGVGLLLVAVFFLNRANKNKQLSPVERGEAKQEFRPLQTKKNMGLEEEIKQIKELISKPQPQIVMPPQKQQIPVVPLDTYAEEIRKLSERIARLDERRGNMDKKKIIPKKKQEEEEVIDEDSNEEEESDY